MDISDLFRSNKTDIENIVDSVLSDGEFDVKSEVMEKLPYTRKVGINDIVPEEYQQKLMQIDLTMSQCYFTIGDIANELVNGVNREKSIKLGKFVTQADIFDAIGFFCHRSGRTIRFYWDVARYFPVEERQRHDVPFLMFAEARWVSNWELFLRIADDNPMWSTASVRAEYHKLVTEERIKDEPKASAISEYSMPEEQPRFNTSVLDELEHTVDKLRLLINKLPLPEDIRERIRDVILEVNDISQTIRREA